MNRIATERKRLDLTQEELAEKLNISQKSISKYETGARKPSFETLTEMAKLFNVSTDYLLGRKNNSPLDLSGLTAAEAAMISKLVASMTDKNKKLEDLER